MDERACWVALNTAPGIGPIRFQRLLSVCGSAQHAWQAPAIELAAAGLERRTIDAVRKLHESTTPEAIVQKLARLQITSLTLLDEDYPLNLRTVADPPPVLFARGSLTAADATAVALVGTRRASGYGMAVADRLSEDLAAAGVTLVSGLAKGIDTVVHRAAVKAGGRTIAVLGNGLDQVYPAQNASLARAIVETHAGALVSEFAPGVPPDAVNFPRRNRIISGLSLVTVIVEAGEPSGALITADFALEQGRDVLTVPGSIFSPTCAGTNQLLKQGATPVTSADDILDVLRSSALSAPPAVDDNALACHVPDLAPDETTVWQALSPEPRHIDALARDLTMRPGDVSATLAVLELKGLARQVGSMLYTRA
ncbi:MAG: DNA-protecting protein DprA [Chloroflexi bacterium]|nr:DNA-protecting protein DprA [Chloroflexota bacterium]